KPEDNPGCDAHFSIVLHLLLLSQLVIELAFYVLCPGCNHHCAMIGCQPGRFAQSAPGQSEAPVMTSGRNILGGSHGAITSSVALARSSTPPPWTVTLTSYSPPHGTVTSASMTAALRA